MLEGFANPDATDTHSRRFSRVQHAQMGRTGLRCSQAGFGCYRIADGVAVHRRSLHQALSAGINLIDTSANYADGDSETLVGNVLAEVVESGSHQREEIILVTKAGYLQGRNLTLSQKRKAEGRPFPDLVTYADQMEHCIHPDFLEDQITRSLNRLNLATVDFFLLHNPEYFLNWATSQQGWTTDSARLEYDRRIQKAFRYLETEIERGRIRYYGISSNTFPEDGDRPDFTCLQRVIALAEKLGPDHHFALVQFPMNLVENGAALIPNQPDGSTLLDTIRKSGLAALVNRPLNAIGPEGLLRLAEVERLRDYSTAEIEQAIQTLISSEDELLGAILPGLAMDQDVGRQIEAQSRFGPALLKQHRAFPSYDYWHQVMTSHLLPRVEGVLAFLDQKTSDRQIKQWIAMHRSSLQNVLEAITSLYSPAAIERAEAIKRTVRDGHPDWDAKGTLSQLAIRALHTTAGISAVLVGMREPKYVADILEELGRVRKLQTHETGWTSIGKRLEHLSTTIDPRNKGAT